MQKFLPNQEMWKMPVLKTSFTLVKSRQGFWEGWWSVLMSLLVAAQSNSWCVVPAALWTGKGLGWGWLGCCPLFLSPVSFLCGFMPLCLELTTSFSHRWAQTVSVWGRLLPWLMRKLSLQPIFVTLSWSTTITLSFFEFAVQDCFCLYTHLTLPTTAEV